MPSKKAPKAKPSRYPLHRNLALKDAGDVEWGDVEWGDVVETIRSTDLACLEGAELQSQPCLWRLNAMLHQQFPEAALFRRLLLSPAVLPMFLICASAEFFPCTRNPNGACFKSSRER